MGFDVGGFPKGFEVDFVGFPKVLLTAWASLLKVFHEGLELDVAGFQRGC